MLPTAASKLFHWTFSRRNAAGEVKSTRLLDFFNLCVNQQCRNYVMPLVRTSHLQQSKLVRKRASLLAKKETAPPSHVPRGHRAPNNANEQHEARDSILQINAPLRVIFGRSGPGAGGLFGSRAIPQAKPRTSETPNSPPAPGPHRGTKKRPCARWIRMPNRGSLWLLPSGPDQIRNMSSSEPIERARRSVYLTRSRPAGQEGANPSDGFAPSCSHR